MFEVYEHRVYTIHKYFILHATIAFIKELKVSYVRNSGWKYPVSYKHKETKRNCKNVSDIGFIITKNVISLNVISLNLCTKLASYNETVQFIKTNLLESLRKCRLYCKIKIYSEGATTR